MAETDLFKTEVRRLENAIKSGERKRVRVTLTPEMVDYLLEKNSVLNRHPSPSRIKLLAESIEENGYVEANDFQIYDERLSQPDSYDGDTSMLRPALINGQHRLMAMQKLYNSGKKIHTSFDKSLIPSQEILVNISKEAAQLVDTAQARTLKQRLHVRTGKDYPARCVSAVRFSIAYHKHYNNSALLDDELVVDTITSKDWQAMFADLSPNMTISSTLGRTYIAPQVYVALKEFRDKIDSSVWKEFCNEFRGKSKAGRVVQGLCAVVALSPREVYERCRHSWGTLQDNLYRITVAILKRYARGCKTMNTREVVPCDWED